MADRNNNNNLYYEELLTIDEVVKFHHSPIFSNKLPTNLQSENVLFTIAFGLLPKNWSSFSESIIE
jgi:hypothetical protein